jgi:hypothetical protein
MISSPYIIIGALVTFSAGYIMTFDVFKGTIGASALIMFYLGLAGLFLISGILYLLSGEKEKGWLPEIISLSLLMALSVLLSLFYKKISYQAYDSAANMITLISNLIFALEIIGIISSGI